MDLPCAPWSKVTVVPDAKPVPGNMTRREECPGAIGLSVELTVLLQTKVPPTYSHGLQREIIAGAKLSCWTRQRREHGSHAALAPLWVGISRMDAGAGKEHQGEQFICRLADQIVCFCEDSPPPSFLLFIVQPSYPTTVGFLLAKASLRPLVDPRITHTLSSTSVITFTYSIQHLCFY